MTQTERITAEWTTTRNMQGCLIIWTRTAHMARRDERLLVERLEGLSAGAGFSARVRVVVTAAAAATVGFFEAGRDSSEPRGSDGLGSVFGGRRIVGAPRHVGCLAGIVLVVAISAVAQRAGAVGVVLRILNGSHISARVLAPFALAASAAWTCGMESAAGMPNRSPSRSHSSPAHEPHSDCCSFNKVSADSASV